jgi:hypothetical protein
MAPLLPAILSGLFPRIEGREVDPRDSVLIERHNSDGKPDPSFGVQAIRPSIIPAKYNGPVNEYRLSAFIEPCGPGQSYSVTLYPKGFSPRRCGSFRFNSAESYDIFDLASLREPRSQEPSPGNSAGLRQARRVATALFGEPGGDLSDVAPMARSGEPGAGGDLRL